MIEILKLTFLSLVMYIIAPPLLGWAVMGGLFEFFDALGIKVRKDRKGKCWLFLSLLIFIFAVLIHTFSRQ